MPSFSTQSAKSARRSSSSVSGSATGSAEMRSGCGTSDAAAECAMAQEMIGEDAGHHRLADRDGADADARVVPAMGFDLDLIAIDIDGAHGMQDRARRLDREAGNDVLAGRDAAENAPGIVRQKDDPAIIHPHLVSVFLSLERRGGESSPDLDTLHRVDRHQRASEVAIEPVIDRLAEPCGNTARHDLDDGAGRGAGLAHTIEII